MSTTSISERNSANSSFYRRNGRRASLLCHPAGLYILKQYVNLKRRGPDELDSELAASLAERLVPVVRQRETEISSCLNETVKEKWYQGAYSSVLGERAEAVTGTLDQKRVSGEPDCVMRMYPLYAEANDCPKHVQLIIEVSVDKNGGEKKMGQAFDYASLMKDQSMTALLFTFHVDRIIRKQLREADLKITPRSLHLLAQRKGGRTKDGILVERSLHTR